MKENLIHYRTCVCNINYHMVWSVKYRQKILTPDIEEYLQELVQQIAEDKGFTSVSIYSDIYSPKVLALLIFVSLSLSISFSQAARSIFAFSRAAFSVSPTRLILLGFPVFGLMYLLCTTHSYFPLGSFLTLPSPFSFLPS